MIDYLRSLTPGASSGTNMIRTPFGTVRGGGRGGRAAVGNTEIYVCNPDTGETETWRISGTRIS